ncbi:hypothetical protein [Bradyrhizobium sp. SZCCHNS30591]|uniref:hypothetical protein n=1 Tax=Bradyrhizobium sp. SZCCHNS30591 TaxID=3057328 RepID=UPI00291633D7|nr:hypothetical protein [Bradyrhizobium sp. SZCCHNS30591]
MKRAWRGPLGVLLLLLAAADPVFGDECLGPNQEPHPYGSFTFKTNSRVDFSYLKGYKHTVISCISHDDPINPLYVKWVIPGPHGWVPAKQRLESLARATNKDQFDQLKGCLLFGNQGETTRGTFIGVENDERRAADEGKVGCRVAVANVEPAPAGIQSFSQKIRNWFPSDATRPRATLMRLDGDVGIDPRNEGFSSYVSYTLTREGDSQGSAADLTARPVFRGAAEALLPYFNEKNPKTIQLREKDVIFFSVPRVANPGLSYASYEVYDKDQRVVGEISLPVFVPVP